MEGIQSSFISIQVQDEVFDDKADIVHSQEALLELRDYLEKTGSPPKFVGLKLCQELVCESLLRPYQSHSNNMLYPKVDRDTLALKIVFVNCWYIGTYISVGIETASTRRWQTTNVSTSTTSHRQTLSLCVTATNNSHHSTLKIVHADVAFDPMLPLTLKKECPKCLEKEAVYIYFQKQSNRDKVCCLCCCLSHQKAGMRLYDVRRNRDCGNKWCDEEQ
jgi:hypothetical protein